MADFLNVGIQYEGLREIGQALRETDRGLADRLKAALGDVGEVAREEAEVQFLANLGKHHRSERSQASIERTARGFHVRVRLSRGGSLVSVEQNIRKKTGRRPDYGGLQVKDGLIPGRDRTIPEATRILERDVVGLLKDHGIA